MQVSTRQLGQSMILDVTGKIDLHNSPQFRQVLMDSLESSPIVMVNLEQVKYMDSSGMATLVEGYHRSKKLGKRILLFNLSSMVRGVLELTHLTKVFEIYDTEEQAQQATNG